MSCSTARFAEAAAFIEPRHLVFDWAFVFLPWSAAAFRRSIEERDAAFGPDRWPANVLSNHDQPRHASRYGDGLPPEIGDARAKVAAALLLTLRGTPFLYYGEEIGQRNLSIPNAQAFDPPARRSSFLFPWWNRDQARGPMPWRTGPGAGFTTGKPWLPLPPDAETRNVEAQAADPDIRAVVLSPAARGSGARRPALQPGRTAAARHRRRRRRSPIVRDVGADRGLRGPQLRQRGGDDRGSPPRPRGPWRLALSTHRDARSRGHRRNGHPRAARGARSPSRAEPASLARVAVARRTALRRDTIGPSHGSCRGDCWCRSSSCDERVRGAPRPRPPSRARRRRRRSRGGGRAGPPASADASGPRPASAFASRAARRSSRPCRGCSTGSR